MKLTLKEIEKIIVYEVVVDCYSDEEANMGWAIYMEENMNYPFEAEYQVKKNDGEKYWQKAIVVNNESDESNFSRDGYYLEIELDEYVIIAQLDKLRNIKADNTTLRTIQVWNHRNSY